MTLQGSNPVAQARTSKEDLLRALAAELRKEKARGVELAREVEATEQQLNAKHEHLLLVEGTYEQEYRRNEAILTHLRREVARVREQLDSALSCGEAEAQQYLSLLKGESEVGSKQTQSCVRDKLAEWRASNAKQRLVKDSPMDPGAASSRSDAHQISVVKQSRGSTQTFGPPLITPRSPRREPKTLTATGAQARTQEKLRRLDERVNRTLDFASHHASKIKIESTSNDPGLEYSRVASDSEYGDTADQESLSQIILGHDELHKRSNKWNKLLSK
ncbi:hypothetical protein OIV83_002721 [Microbotryomycetes sp. JL201]|nr:hypothetical protein OIV83_002721 [Microbotryomycetes sp. JL201]